MKSQNIFGKETALSNLNPTCRRVADFELVKRALAGDPEAFTTLFNTHKTTIYSICLRMTNNIAQAEDLTQDAFLQVFRKLSTFRGDSALSTWLYRIAVNTVLMHFRKKVLKQVSLDDIRTRTHRARTQLRCAGNMAVETTGSTNRWIASCWPGPLGICRLVTELFSCCTRSKGMSTWK